MLLDILRHTPLWVYGLLVFLLGRGTNSRRPSLVVARDAWDHLSSYEEQDIVAITGFFRAMPPVHEVVPKWQAPSAAECQIYTHWTGKSSTPGCKQK